MKVMHSGTLVYEYVPVCINGQGPFPFIVDTGASQSVVDTALGRILRLTPSGPARIVPGIDCLVRVQSNEVASWSLGSIPLEPQTLEGVSIPGFGARDAPAGLIGSDVLSRFGAVRLDFRSQSLLVAEDEGPMTEDGVSRGDLVPSTVDSLLASGDPYTTVPLSVASGHGAVVATVQVRIGAGDERFILDTGAGQSAISTTLAESLPLRASGRHEPVATAGCTIETRLVESGRWSTGSVTLSPQPLLSMSFGAIDAAGLLGSGTLSRFGWMVIDYDGADLLVGHST